MPTTIRGGLTNELFSNDGNPSPVDGTFSFGVGGNSLLPCRGNDTFGAGYFITGLSNDFRDVARRVLPQRNEQGVELYYNVAVTPWFHVTANTIWVAPSIERFDPAYLFGLRAKIDF